MTYVVTENCIKCKYQDCVIVCPVVCFHEAPEIIVIDPDVCVDCALCVDYCPTKAIKKDEDLALNEQIFLKLNRELSGLWPVIENKGAVPSDADEWAGVPDKIKYLAPSG
jgi:ferredoxin